MVIDIDIENNHFYNLPYELQNYIFKLNLNKLLINNIKSKKLINNILDNIILNTYFDIDTGSGCVHASRNWTIPYGKKSYTNYFNTLNNQIIIEYNMYGKYEVFDIFEPHIENVIYYSSKIIKYKNINKVINKDLLHFNEQYVLDLYNSVTTYITWFCINNMNIRSICCDYYLDNYELKNCSHYNNRKINELIVIFKKRLINIINSIIKLLREFDHVFKNKNYISDCVHYIYIARQLR